ncbi:MAG TPA: hypothetical protein VN281_17065, partial [Verrucomicrobiae bacterium]|nr:hypothetical protein [Verrucomicrobiae bacterium]
MKTLQLIHAWAVIVLFSVFAGVAGAADSPGAAADTWKDPAQPIEARVKDLVGRLTLEEKISQMRCDTAPIPRLGIPAY